MFKKEQMKKLREIFNSHDGRLVHKLSHYFEIYERYFEKYRGTDAIILEIGVSHGGSLQMWREYFGPAAKIFAVDINPECKRLEDDNIFIFIGSQEDPQFPADLTKRIPRPDIIIDDGGHTMRQQIASFEILYDYVKDDGIYLCEDTCTSYWYEYGGGLGRKSSFIEYSKKKIDHLYAWYFKSRKIRSDSFAKSTNAIHFYDSMVIFERMKKEKPDHLTRGEKTINHNEDPMANKRTLFHRIVKKLRSI